MGKFYQVIEKNSKNSLVVFRDGKIPKGGSWTKSYRVTSDYKERSKNSNFLSPCFTYENPNEYILGKSNATVSNQQANLILICVSHLPFVAQV